MRELAVAGATLAADRAALSAAGSATRGIFYAHRSGHQAQLQAHGFLSDGLSGCNVADITQRFDQDPKSLTTVGNVRALSLGGM
jgi:hypothetical protein